MANINLQLLWPLKMTCISTFPNFWYLYYMKTHILLPVIMLFCKITLAQTPHAIWEDPINGGYKYVQLNAATGVKTNISNLPSLTGFVMGDASAINYNLNHYHFIAQINTNRVLFTLDLSSGAIISSPAITNTVVGMEYNCADSTLYAIQVNGNAYNFVKVDPATAALTTVAAITNMQGYVGGSFSLDLANQVYTYKVLTSTVFKLRSIDVKTGAVLYDNPFPDNVAGHKYSPTDNAVYGMWENNNVYQLEQIDYTTGTHSMVATYTVITPGYVGESVSMNQNGEYTFRGFDKNNNFSLFTLDCTNGAVLNYSNTSDNAAGFEEPVCVTGSTSIAEANENSIRLYPNPAQNNFTVETPDGGTLTVYDVVGTQVLFQKLHGPLEIVLVDGLNHGVYSVFINVNDASVTKRLVIIK